MGKASKWLKRVLGFNKPDPHSKRRWSFAREKDRRPSQGHAIAIAAASAAVAEAAVAAAQAAAVVVSLTTGGGGYNSENVGGYGRREERAAVMIQSHFRAYLSRQALKALKALVMLQALVRGQIVRKHVQLLRHVRPTSPIYHSGKGSRSNMAYDHYTRTGERSWQQPPFTRIISPDDERNDKILQVDTWKPKHNHFSPQLTHNSNQYFQNFSISGEIRPLSHVKFSLEDDQNDFTTAENSPQYYSASSSMGSRRALFHTPTKSDGSSHDYPSYMAYTESSKAKVRSLSAPKQRPPQYERSSSTNRYSFQKASTLHANFTNKVYPGSGRLNRLGMPVRGDVSRFSGGHWHRF